MLKLPADGLPVKEVPARLGPSAKTAEVRKHDLMRHLDVHDRAT